MMSKCLHTVCNALENPAEIVRRFLDKISLYAYPMMCPGNDVQTLLMKLHLIHWRVSYSLLFEVTLERLQEPTVVDSIYGVVAVHSCFMQIINRACKLRQRFKHSKHEFGGSELRQYL